MGIGKWFDRKFDFNFGPDAYNAIYQRLKKAPDILQQLVLHLPKDVQLHALKLYETPRIYVEYFGH